MDHFNQNRYDHLLQEVEHTEKQLKAATPDTVDRLLNRFIMAKESFVKYKKQFDL